jgi:ribosomal protein S18 acetylase RimI-like enzyme
VWTVEIRAGTSLDAANCAALHADQIAQGFLPALGQPFLRRLYRRITRFPDSFVFIAEGEGATAGFIAGCADVGGLYRSFLMRDGIPAGAQAVGPALANWRRVLDTLGHATSGSEKARGSELLAIAVDPSWQGHRVGQALVDAFLAEVALRGGDAAHVVVGADNRAAIALYERCGFGTVERFELHAGTESLLMQWDLQRPEKSPADQPVVQ